MLWESGNSSGEHDQCNKNIFLILFSRKQSNFSNDLSDIHKFQMILNNMGDALILPVMLCICAVYSTYHSKTAAYK